MPESEVAHNTFLFSQSPTAAPAGDDFRQQAHTVEQAPSDDGEAFGEIYKSFAPLVHGIVLARVPYDEVKDIVQEVFLSAYKNLHTLRDKAAIGAWLSRIARNRAAEYYRQARQTEELSEDISGASRREGEAAEILRAIRSMPEAYRETLVLRLVEGMTGSEIAGRTGLTPESVRVNLHRGMELLRQKLDIGGAGK